MKEFLFISLTLIFACGSGLKIIKPDLKKKAPWHEPYIGGMNGVENLVFDGRGNLYVTGLDGTIYKIKPTQNPYKGEVVLKKKVGKACLGIVVSAQDYLDVGICDEEDQRRMAKMSKDFSISIFRDSKNHSCLRKKRLELLPFFVR